jgi:glycosyltransferase involved in cell wall biosynthesis
MPERGDRSPEFSILLPTHNRADVLPWAIRSVLAQTEQNFELLIVGDGCTDNTAEVVRSFADDRIRWFDLPKAPHFGYANRNLVLREARGAVVAFMAHDDLWLPDHLDLLASCLESTGSEIAYSRPLWVIPRGLIAPTAFNLNYRPTLEGFLTKRHRHMIPAACVVHRRECLVKYGYWNESLREAGDWDLWIRIIEGGGRRNFVYLPTATNLHFRANWRTESTIEPTLKVWKLLHEDVGVVPDALKFDVPQGMTEQEAAWRRLEDGAGTWTAELRRAVDAVLDARVAQSDALMLNLLGVMAEHSAGWNSTDTLARSYAGLAEDFELAHSRSGKLLARARLSAQRVRALLGR